MANDFGKIWEGLPKFKGVGYPPVHVYLRSIDECAEVSDWSDAQKIFVAKFKMTDAAQVFLEGCASLQKEKKWVDFKRRLMERFGNKDSGAIKMLKFLETKQLESENIMSFASRLQLLGSKICPAIEGESTEEASAREKLLNEKMVMQFLIGIRNKEIKRGLISENNFSKMVKKASIEEANERLLSLTTDNVTIAAMYGASGTKEQQKPSVSKGPKLDFAKLALDDTKQKEQGAGDNKKQGGWNFRGQNASRGGGATFSRGQYNNFGRGRGAFFPRGGGFHNPNYNHFYGGQPHAQQYNQQYMPYAQQNQQQQQHTQQQQHQPKPAIFCLYCGELNHVLKNCTEFNANAKASNAGTQKELLN